MGEQNNNLKNNIVCDCNTIHKDIVSKVIADLPEDMDIMEVGKLFKVLGEYTRVKIVVSLLESDLCVCDIAYVLNMTKSTVSHQLAVLKKMNIVKYERRGKEVVYSLDDDHVKSIISKAFEHIGHTKHCECGCCHK